MVIGQGMKLVLVGLAVGLFGALAVTRVLKSLLFGVSATDPLTFVVIASLLTLLPCWPVFYPLDGRRRSIRSWRCALSEEE